VARLGQTLDKQQLGGASIQTRCGAINNVVDSEDEAFTDNPVLNAQPA